MQLDFGQIIVWLIIGSLAGLLAGFLMRGRSYGTLTNMIIGLIGAVIGGLVFRGLGISITGLPTFTFSLADLVVAFIGSVIFLLLLRVLNRR